MMVPFLRRHFLRILIAFVSILCAFSAHFLHFWCPWPNAEDAEVCGQASWPTLPKSLSVAFVVHLWCIYERECRDACGMHVDARKWY